MNASNTFEYVEEWRPGQPDKFHVAVVYETALDGMRAKSFSDEVVAETGHGKPFDMNMNVWSFAALQASDICCLAACAAAAANLVVISVAGGGDLPAQVEKWLKTWAALAQNKNQLAAVLFAGPVQDDAPILAALRRSVMRAGIDCFTHTPRGNTGERYCEKLLSGDNTSLRGETRSTAGQSRSAVAFEELACCEDRATGEMP